MASHLSAHAVFIASQGSQLFSQSFTSGLQLEHDTIRSWLAAIAATVLGWVMLCAASDSQLRALEIAIGSHVVYAITFSRPAMPSASTRLVDRLMPGRQVLGCLALAATHIWSIQPMAPPSGFILEPVAIGFVNFICQLLLAMRGFPMSIKLCLLAILPGMHTLHPIYGIGMDEAMLVFFGQVTGMLCGHAIHLDQLLLVAAVEVANMNRRADSRLNHVIKGQCGGASALLSGLRRMLELDGRAPTDEIGEIMQQIQGMLDDAADWCHSREVFVQLEAGTYQVRARAAPARSARARAAAITAGAPAASAAIYLLDAPHSGEWGQVSWPVAPLTMVHPQGCFCAAVHGCPRRAAAAL